MIILQVIMASNLDFFKDTGGSEDYLEPENDMIRCVYCKVSLVFVYKTD